MGKGKRHFKGGNSSDEKRRRKEAADKWRSVRGDAQPGTGAGAGTGTGSRVSGGKSWVLENDKFDAFYRAQHFIDEGEDWDRFMRHLQTPLPACFRICPDYPFANELRDQMLSYVGHKIEVESGMEIQPAEQLPWYPNGFGYKLGVDRRAIRKLGVLTDLHKWMIRHTDNGNITRQEAVSMVPPLALDVQPHHRCLDMCAAPGSKTTQLLEIVNRSLVDPDPSRRGLVVANDSDTDRAYMLVHQCKRINSPLLVVTTHKGQYFPFIADDTSSPVTGCPVAFFDRVLCDVPCSGDGTLRKNPAIWKRWSTSMGMTLHPLQLMIAKRGLQLLKDDCLMVYSTCSMSPYENEAVVAELLRCSDGCLELVDPRQFLPLFKTRPGLKKWYVLDDYGMNQHHRRRQQVETKGARGVPSAEPGSGNTDAVADDVEGGEVRNDGDDDDHVHDAKGLTNIDNDNDGVDAGDAEIVCDEGVDADMMCTDEADASSCDPSTRPPPCDNWSHIADPSLRRCLEMGMTLHGGFDSVPSHLDRRVRKSMFPPTEEESAWMHLERCMRCVPHDEDTGGFFVATLKKVKKPTKCEEPLPLDDDGDDDVVDTTTTIAEAAPVAAVGELDREQAACGSTSSTQGPHKTTTTTTTGLVDFHPWDAESFLKMKAFYGLADSLTADSFYVREDAVTASSSGAAKTIFFLPHSARALMCGDKSSKLKIVTAGVKVFEKKLQRDGSVDYRLLQDGVAHLAPMISQRTTRLCVQDFSNLLGGGLVSFHTLSPAAIQALLGFTSGVVICWYDYDPRDQVPTAAAAASGEVASDPVVCAAAADIDASSCSSPHHRFHIICWRGYSRALNVMCGKVDLDSMKHQLSALGVLRPKIAAPKDTSGTPAVSGNDQICEGHPVVVTEDGSGVHPVIEDGSGGHPVIEDGSGGHPVIEDGSEA